MPSSRHMPSSRLWLPRSRDAQAAGRRLVLRCDTLLSREPLTIMNLMQRQSRPWLRRSLIGSGIAVPVITAMIWMRSDSDTLRTVELQTPNGPITVQVADTAAARSAGLSNRDALPATDGMLLKWEASRRHPIWMAGMRFPLDLVWIDPGGRVLAVLANVPPCRAEPCPLFEPDDTAGSIAVLELPAGAASRYRIATGGTISPANEFGRHR
jgi:uncharacterized protein